MADKPGVLVYSSVGGKCVVLREIPAVASPEQGEGYRMMRSRSWKGAWGDIDSSMPAIKIEVGGQEPLHEERKSDISHGHRSASKAARIDDQRSTKALLSTATFLVAANLRHLSA
jgi:hypothetical protein